MVDQSKVNLQLEGVDEVDFGEFENDLADNPETQLKPAVERSDSQRENLNKSLDEICREDQRSRGGHFGKKPYHA
jgi:hypothetical protein